MTDLLLTLQVFWERFGGWILVALVAAWMLICVDIGAGRAR